MQTLREPTRRPLLLPVFLLGQQQVLLHEETEALWLDLLRVENASGQTGVIVVPTDEQSQGGGRKVRAASKDHRRPRRITNKQITNKVLGVVQLASTWESHIKALIQDIKAAKESVKKVESATTNSSGSGTQAAIPPAMDKGITSNSGTLEESLGLFMHKANTVLWDLEYINKRASAQMDAVYNHTTRQIAVAAKQDSSNMKAIDRLPNHGFLPTTFLATMFSMPFFNFPSSSTQLIKPAFRYHWALCVLLTVVVFCMYGLYVLWRQRKQCEDKAEDEPEEITQEKQGTEAAQTASGVHYSGKDRKKDLVVFQKEGRKARMESGIGVRM